MSSKTELRLAWCSHEAAKYAVMNWHYSRAMPSGKLIKIGAWENKKFIGCVLFGRGANNNMGKPFGLEQTEICELVRIALSKHQTPVTRIVSIAIRMLKKKCPGLRLIVTYADPRQGHEGGIYKGGNWVYLGRSKPWKGSHYIVNGKKMHGRSVRAKWGNEKNIPYEWEYDLEGDKHKYIYPLDKSLIKICVPGVSVAREAPQPRGGGSTPTGTL